MTFRAVFRVVWELAVKGSAVKVGLEEAIESGGGIPSRVIK